MRSVLLDTNAYSHLVTGDTRVSDAMGQAEEVLLSVFVLGELHAGFRGGTKRRQNLEDLRRFLAKPKVRVLDATIETAEVYGMVSTSLEEAGARIPVHDAWIAAQAIQTGSVLITYDTHFLRVPGLRIWPALEPG
jgi:tRNA(fMet)-specific endonuclease VapC